jgi:hypothetical protein
MRELLRAPRGMSVADRADMSAAFQAALHSRLADLNANRFRPSTPLSASRIDADARLATEEDQFLSSERYAVRARAQTAPNDPASFARWFEALEDDGPGQHDPLFDWLAQSASLSSIRWFLAQEMAGEAGFDDLVALSQRKIDVRAKLEMARNYWDEMGAGREAGMHGPMLTRLIDELAIDMSAPVVWESLALANLMCGLAFNRRYAFHAIGALGAIELTAPGRCVLVDAALKRLGVGGEARRYYSLHAVIDLRHSKRWVAEVLEPLVDADGSRARWLAEGALMRLNAGRRTFDRYRFELGVTS